MIRSRTGGGGGFGPALEREPADVQRDVLDGLVSVEAARTDYGVVLDDDLAVDAQATNQARSAAA